MMKVKSPNYRNGHARNNRHIQNMFWRKKYCISKKKRKYKCVFPQGYHYFLDFGWHKIWFLNNLKKHFEEIKFIFVTLRKQKLWHTYQQLLEMPLPGTRIICIYVFYTRLTEGYQHFLTFRLHKIFVFLTQKNPKRRRLLGSKKGPFLVQKGSQSYGGTTSAYRAENNVISFLENVLIEISHFYTKI